MLSNLNNLPPEVATSATFATPEPLWEKGSSMAEFPLHALGVLEDAVRACAKLSNAHLGTCAQSILAVAALATQGHVDVKHPNGSSIPISLFFLTIAESGDGKSACDRFAQRPVRLREEKMRKESSQENDDESSVPPMLICQEPTNEGLFKLLLKGHPCQGIFSDEGGQFIGGYGMRETRESMLPNLCSLWGGNGLTRVRASELPTILNGRRISLHLMFQPIVAHKLISDEYAKSQGFLARCLIISPPSMAGKRKFQKPNSNLDKIMHDYNERILEILDSPIITNDYDGSIKPRLLTLSENQEALWTQFQHEIEEARGNDGPYYVVREFTAKLSEHVLRLSAVLSFIENPITEIIDDKSLNNAITLGKFYLNEVLRLEEEEKIPQEIQDAQKLLSWLQAKQYKTFTQRDVCNAGPNSIRNKNAACKAISVLIAKRWVIASTQKGEPYRLYNA